MIIKASEASERAQIFKDWTASQPSNVQLPIKEWKYKLGKLNNISDVSTDELLCQVILLVHADMKRHP